MSRQEDGRRGSPSPAEGGRRPSGAGEGDPRPKRFWAQHKTEAVLRLLRGEDIELLSRELGVTAAHLSEWKEAFLAAGAQGLKRRPAKEAAEVKRLNEKVGEQTMEIELLREKIARMEQGSPLARRRSKK